MSSLTEFFRRKEGVQTPELPPHEIAQIIRERGLDAMSYGVLSSKDTIPESQNPKATKLPHLLRYSPRTTRHFATLQGILRTPGAIFDPNTVDENNVVLSDTAEWLTYRFSDTITNLYHDNANPSNIFQHLNVFIDYSKVNDFWKINYHTYKYPEPSSQSAYGIDSTLPERNYLLQFWFSPVQLDHGFFLKKMLSEHLRDHLQHLETKTQDGFRRIVLHHQGKKQAETELNGKFQNRFQVADVLKQNGDRDIAIVEIGQVLIGGKTYWVYTGAEQPAIQVKEEKTSKAPSFTPVSVFG